MENTRKSNLDFEAIAWGAFFILWGSTSMFKFLPDGTAAAGIGLILIGLNVARAMSGRPTRGFTTVLGILALLTGGLEMVRSFLHLSFEMPTFAILLLALGAIVMGSALRAQKS
jgi:hypothetical protein